MLKKSQWLLCGECLTNGGRARIEAGRSLSVVSCINVEIEERGWLAKYVMKIELAKFS